MVSVLKEFFLQNNTNLLYKQFQLEKVWTDYERFRDNFLYFENEIEEGVVLFLALYTEHNWRKVSKH